MKNLKVPGYIKDGILHVNGAYAEKLVREQSDGHVMITLNKYSQRSNMQNRYLHGVLIPEFRRAMYKAGYREISNDTVAKDLMKLMFLKFSITNEETGEVIEYIKNTSDLDKIEMAKLYDDVIMFCAENLSYIIPYPSEKLHLNFQ